MSAENEKPWQGMIDMCQDMVNDWVELGFDKERPDEFQKMQKNLEGFKEKQRKLSTGVCKFCGGKADGSQLHSDFVNGKIEHSEACEDCYEKLN